MAFTVEQKRRALVLANKYCRFQAIENKYEDTFMPIEELRKNEADQLSMKRLLDSADDEDRRIHKDELERFSCLLDKLK